MVHMASSFDCEHMVVLSSRCSSTSFRRTKVCNLRFSRCCSILTLCVANWPRLSKVRSPISGYTGSDEAISKAYSWLKTCLSEHMDTCSALEVTTLPTRVLRIDGPQRVALYVSKGEKTDYTCLSHCWGKHPLSLLRTTTGTIEGFQSEIAWNDLPKT